MRVHFHGNEQPGTRGVTLEKAQHVHLTRFLTSDGSVTSHAQLHSADCEWKEDQELNRSLDRLSMAAVKLSFERWIF